MIKKIIKFKKIEQKSQILSEKQNKKTVVKIFNNILTMQLACKLFNITNRNIMYKR